MSVMLDGVSLAGTITVDGALVGGGSGPGVDTTAIHRNVADEFDTIPAKAAPVAADTFLGENSEAGGAKFKTTLVNLPFAASGILGFGASTVNATTTLRYLRVWNQNAAAQTTELVFVAPRDGDLQTLVVKHTSGNGNGNDIVYTVYVNGSPTSITVTIASTSEVAVTDSVNTQAILAGDEIALVATKALAIGSSPSGISAEIELL